jgi:putative glycosyltransferase (TIGR04372 family)
MYKRTLPVVTNDKLHFSIINGGHRYLRKINRFIEDNYRNGMVFYPECPEFISFTDEETKYGYSLLEKIGIGKSDTYVTMHNKDNVYWKQRNGIEKSWDIYRDSEFSALKKSIEFLGDQDIKVIRSGHYEDEPERGYYSLNVLDSSEKDFMDIFIQKHCFFSVNGDSGIALIPYLFRKPILLHNAIPLGESPIVECGIVIPKIMKNAASGTILPISEILQKKVLLGYADRGRFCISSVSAEKFQNISHYQAHGIEIQDNTAEEILDGIKEMIAYVNGKFRLSEEQQKMQGRFRELFPVAHPMRHFIGYVSPSFLENYPEILN